MFSRADLLIVVSWRSVGFDLVFRWFALTVSATFAGDVGKETFVECFSELLQKELCLLLSLVFALVGDIFELMREISTLPRILPSKSLDTNRHWFPLRWTFLILVSLHILRCCWLHQTLKFTITGPLTLLTIIRYIAMIIFLEKMLGILLIDTLLSTWVLWFLLYSYEVVSMTWFVLLVQGMHAAHQSPLCLFFLYDLKSVDSILWIMSLIRSMLLRFDLMLSSTYLSLIIILFLVHQLHQIL